jgi:hypothetical protein
VPTGKVFLMRSPSVASLTSIEVADINEQSSGHCRREDVDDDDDRASLETTLFVGHR